MTSRRFCSAFWICLLLWHTAAGATLIPRSGTPLIPRSAVLPKITVRAAARSFQVGDTLTVPAYSFRLGNTGYYQTTTTCRWVGQHCYVFVEDAVWGTTHVTQAGIESLVQAFDQSTPRDPNRGIYDIETGIFGPPPDVDGDPRILIVVLDILDSPITGSTYTGYFDLNNESPPTSHEIVYIDCDPLILDSNLARATLSHEFQHMLQWRGDPHEDKWVDEGCSEYAELACGYKDTTQTAGSAFLEVPNTSLTQWNDSPFDYDEVFLWTTYFAQRYGDSAITALVADPAHGIDGYNHTLESIGSPDRFPALFAAWTAATYLDGPGNLGYERLDLGPVYRDTAAVPVQNLARKVRLWGIDYQDLQDAPGVLVDLRSSGDDSLMAVLISVHDSLPAVTTYTVPAGGEIRFADYGPNQRTLAVTRTSGTSEDYSLSTTSQLGTSPFASDFNGDGFINFADFVAFAKHYGRQAGDPGFDPTYDLNGDRRIAFDDFLIFAKNYGGISP